jgi:hypothetical protein
MGKLKVTKSQTVLRRDRAPFPTSKRVIYRPADFNDIEAYGRQTLFGLDVDLYGEMGEPETITLTIEPGDRLNAVDGCHPAADLSGE